MRIEKVVIENINSLAGRFEVDFTDRGYSGGLFAIVGPSGAGKTTVLDAICLALYGKTPRIDTVSMTQDELMTKGTSFCSAEVVFVSRGRRYKAVFSHKRSGGANPFRAAERAIVEYTGHGPETIAASITDANARIVEVTGLDYTRFTRSILLAQFRFAEFLKASANERAEILEQVTDMGLYRRISAAVYERAKREEDALLQIRMKSELIAAPDEAQEAALAAELKTLEAALPAQAKLREALRQCADAIKAVAGYEKALETDTALTPLLQKALADSEALHSEAAKAEQDAAAALEALRATLKTVRALDIQIEAQKKECGRIDKAVQEQDAAILNHKKRVIEVFKRYEPEADGPRLKEMYEAADTAALLRAGVQAETDAATQKQREIKAQIAALLCGKDEPYWRAHIETLRGRAALAEAREALAKAYLEKAEEAKAQSALAERLKAAKADAEKAEKKYEYALLDRQFGEERRRLTEGTPCPLCGATSHPYAQRKAEASFFEAAETERKEAAAALKQIERGIAESGQRMAGIEARIAEQEQAVKQHTEKLGEEPPEATAEQAKAALEAAEKRMREYPALLKKLSEAADEAGKLAARMGEIDKDVQAVTLRKEQIGEAQKQADALRGELGKAQGILSGLTQQREALFGSKDADAEEAAAVNAQQAAQARKEQRRAAAVQAAGALERNGSDIERTKALLEKERAALQEIYKDAARQAKQAEKADERFARLGDKPDGGAVSAAAEALDGIITAATERKALVAQGLADIDRNRKALRELKAAERAQKQRVEKWGRLNLLIGSREGDKFSRMAQGITFDALLRYANVSLSRMTDQYVLVRDMEGGKPLELAVLDMYRAGEQRPVSNLSGGESFLVSLSLALGLSEMSSGRARIDSLFIDEGFASLDENYLEAALQTLSALSSREGKLVGVISHVEALKERIDAQIEVKKLLRGHSTLFGPGVTAQEA
jgi:exonuclease SbcC